MPQKTYPHRHSIPVKPIFFLQSQHLDLFFCVFLFLVLAGEGGEEDVDVEGGSSRELGDGIFKEGEGVMEAGEFLCSL